ncbi:MFS transporter [Dermabacteraceae bacterium TAE3-ERU5]|nr:MFS transporter [Dermabacteraceae bacterium TAE3-ERU5]
MAFIIVPMAILANGHSPTTAGAVAGTVAAIGIISQIFSGVIADRFSPSTLIRVASVTQMLCWLAIAAAQAFQIKHPLVICILGSIAAAFASVSVPSEHSIIQRIVPKQLYAKANSVTQGREAAANLLGAPAAGLIFGLSHLASYITQAFFHFTASILVPHSPSKGDATRETGISILGELKSGFSFVFKNSELRTLIAAASIINLPMAMLPIAMISNYQSLGYSPLLIGVYASSMGVGIVFGATFADRALEKLSPATITLTSIATLALSILATSFASNIFALTCLFYFLGGLPLPAINSLMASYTMLITPDHMLGKVVAASGVPGMALMPLGSYLGGKLYQEYGIQNTLLVAALIACSAAAPVIFSKKFHRMPKINHHATSASNC